MKKKVLQAGPTLPWPKPEPDDDDTMLHANGPWPEPGIESTVANKPRPVPGGEDEWKIS